MAKKTNVLQVTEIHSLPHGEVRLILKDGSSVIVNRVTPNYSSAHRFPAGFASDVFESVHKLLAIELPKPGEGITF